MKDPQTTPDTPTTEDRPAVDADVPVTQETAKGPRLSILRMGVAIVLVGAAALGSTKVTIDVRQEQERRSSQWFAPYVDVTLPPFFNFQDPLENPSEDVVLAFVVASKTEPCTPTWGASFDLDTAASELDLDRRIVRHRQRGGDVIVSFGGVANDELAVSCTDADQLAAAYRAVVERYELRAIDLDIEGEGLDAAASARRATAIAQVQAEQRAAGKGLDVWVTLPVAPDGLPQAGIAVVDSLLRAQVDLTGVNVMAMEFGASRAPGTSFADASLAALDATALQVQSAYLRAGRTLGLPGAYAKLGVTPMIGQNDVPADRLDTDGARRLADRASDRGITRFSLWSLNRDVACSDNVNAAVANTACSGVPQDRREFSIIFGAVDGRATGAEPVEEVVAGSGRTPVADEIGTGPYDDWRPRREYEMATKIVWRGQVYEAKWWNVGSQPDAPVEHEWDSPWRVLGPVLATDRPVVTRFVLPEGTYPEWKPRTIYEPGDRVQYRGVGYRAKWWTRGEDPTADVDNEWESPWDPLPVSALPASPPPA